MHRFPRLHHNQDDLSYSPRLDQNSFAPELRLDDLKTNLQAPAIVELSKFVVEGKRLCTFNFNEMLFNTRRASLVTAKIAFERLNGIEIPGDDWLACYQLLEREKLTSEPSAATVFEEAKSHFCPESRTSTSDFMRVQRQILKKYFLDLDLKPNEEAFGLVEKVLRAGMTCSICTSAGREIVDRVLQHFKVENYFTMVVCADDISAGYQKPTPYPYTLLLRALSEKPGLAVSFESSCAGAAAARSAGISACVNFEREGQQEEIRKLKDLLNAHCKLGWPYSGPPISVVSSWRHVEIE